MWWTISLWINGVCRLFSLQNIDPLRDFCEKTKQNRKLISTKINNEAIWGWWKCLSVPYFLQCCSVEGAAGFYELLVKRVAHLECSTCRLWVFADICIHGPPQDLLRFFLLAWWFFVFISMFLLSSLSLYAHIYFLCMCMAKKKREAIFSEAKYIVSYIYSPRTFSF